MSSPYDIDFYKFQPANEPPVDLGCLADREAEKTTCVWTLDDIDNVWNTGCGEAFCFTDEGPEKNGCLFCHHCGKPLRIVRPSLCPGYSFPEGSTCGKEKDYDRVLCDDCDEQRVRDQLELDNQAAWREWQKGDPMPGEEVAYPHLTDKE